MSGWRGPGGGRRDEPTTGRTRRGAGGRRRTTVRTGQSVAQIRTRRRRLGRMTLVLSVVIVVLSIGFTLFDSEGDPEGDALRHPEPETLTAVRVVDVIDGDTLDVRAAETELRVRLFGVDTPERGERCAEEATARLRSLASAEVRLLADERQRDGFGRELRYVFTADGRSIDAALIHEGLGHAWRDDGALRDVLVELEAEAQTAERGCLWSD